MQTNNSPGEMACYPPPSAAGNEFTAPAADPASLTITRPLLEEALAAKPALAALSSEEKKAVLLSMADALEADTKAILAANALDLEAAQGHIAPVMQDRLRLTVGLFIKNGEIKNRLVGEVHPLIIQEEIKKLA